MNRQLKTPFVSVRKLGSVIGDEQWREGIGGIIGVGWDNVEKYVSFHVLEFSLEIDVLLTLRPRLRG